LESPYSVDRMVHFVFASQSWYKFPSPGGVSARYLHGGVIYTTPNIQAAERISYCHPECDGADVLHHCFANALAHELGHAVGMQHPDPERWTAVSITGLGYFRIRWHPLFVELEQSLNPNSPDGPFDPAWTHTLWLRDYPTLKDLTDAIDNLPYYESSLNVLIRGIGEVSTLVLPQGGGGTDTLVTVDVHMDRTVMEASDGFNNIMDPRFAGLREDPDYKRQLGLVDVAANYGFPGSGPFGTNCRP